MHHRPTGTMGRAGAVTPAAGPSEWYSGPGWRLAPGAQRDGETPPPGAGQEGSGPRRRSLTARSSEGGGPSSPRLGFSWPPLFLTAQARAVAVFVRVGYDGRPAIPATGNFGPVGQGWMSNPPPPLPRRRCRWRRRRGASTRSACAPTPKTEPPCVHASHGVGAFVAAAGRPRRRVVTVIALHSIEPAGGGGARKTAPQAQAAARRVQDGSAPTSRAGGVRVCAAAVPAGRGGRGPSRAGRAVRVCGPCGARRGGGLRPTRLHGGAERLQHRQRLPRLRRRRAGGSRPRRAARLCTSPAATRGVGWWGERLRGCSAGGPVRRRGDSDMALTPAFAPPNPPLPVLMAAIRVSCGRTRRVAVAALRAAAHARQPHSAVLRGDPYASHTRRSGRLARPAVPPSARPANRFDPATAIRVTRPCGGSGGGGEGVRARAPRRCRWRRPRGAARRRRCRR